MRFRIVGLVFLISLLASCSQATDLKTVRAQRGPEIQSSLTQKGLVFGAPIYIRIFKDSREMELWVQTAQGYALYKTYKICSFSGDLGPKLKEGDGQSPEGFYSVGQGQLNPNSQYHLAFNLGYPNAYDRAHGRTGSYLMVHGNCVSIGCYAMTDKGIEEIYLLAEAALKGGQPRFQVDIYPFRLTPANMQRYANHRWIGFWQEMRPAYEAFERTHLPPQITVTDGHYRLQ